MSLPDGAKNGTRRQSARNPRRRQRLDSDSVGHQPRRKRSKITTETYDAPAIPDGTENGSVVMNGHANGRGRQSSTPIDSLDMPVRAKKNAQKRAVKGDGSTVLTQNAHYSLRHLPSTPDIIRNSASDFHGYILPSPAQALALTTEHAYIWDYTSPVPVAHPRCFDVPQPVKRTDPLPLGALVTNGASTSVGLVIIPSSTGKILFWENIDTAESLSLFNQRNAGVEGSLGSLFSGETAIDITSAEHAGFIVTMSSGRIAQISLRDAQGKPKIATQFLKANDGMGSGGLFGSIKGVLGVGWKRDVVALHTRSQGSRGQMQVMSLTAGGQMQIWDLAWSGHASFRGTVEFRELLQREVALSASQQQGGSVKLLDFAVAPSRARGDEVATLGNEQPIDLVLLTRTGNEEASMYALVEVTLSASTAYVERTIIVRRNLVSSDDDKARLLLPKPGHTAHIVFEQKVILVSLAIEEAGPDAQLLMEAHKSPDTFQDAIYLREDRGLVIAGCDEQDSSDRQSQSSSVMFVKGYGLIRLIANEPESGGRFRVSVKSRIEQDIFYGTQQDNIIDFAKQKPHDYSQEDAEHAAVLVSDEILRSESPFLSTSLLSQEAQILLRIKTAKALITYTKKHYAPISPATRYQLLTDAEKLVAGLSLWRGYDLGLQEAAPKPTMLPAVIKLIRKQTRDIRVNLETEMDEVRHWLTYDVCHVDKLCYSTLAVINKWYEDKRQKNFMKLLSETDDLIFGTFETVCAFRSENAELYGIDATLIADGILEEGWEGLPEPWSATHELINLLDRYIDNARNFAIEYYEKPENQNEIDDVFVNKVVHENVRLVQILCLCYRERIGWCSAHNDDKFRNYAPGLTDKFMRSREHHLRGLQKIGQAAAGTAVAEKYRDMDSLVKLVVSESAYLVESLQEDGLTDEERGMIQDRMDVLQAKVGQYFRTFGDEWATAFFDSHLTSHRSYGLLGEAVLHQGPLTRFMRAEKARGRLGWINEVLREDNLDQAQKALTSLAQEHENRLWNKKVELSIAKLTALAANEDSTKQKAINGALQVNTGVQDSELTVIAVQEEIYSHLQPILYAAMDHDAEVQIVSDAYAISIRKLPALHQLLEIAFDDLLSHKVLSAEQLVDVLTLMDSVPSNDGIVDICGREFHLAMRVLKGARSSMEPARFDTAVKLVWKRCYLRDEWDLLDKTARKSDHLVQMELRDTTLCQTMVLGLQDDSASGITFLPPGEVLGAGSTLEDLQDRFPSDDLRDPIIHDNVVQDDQLKERIDEDRLQHWFEACREEAKKVLEEEAVVRTEEDKAVAHLQQSIVDNAAAKTVSKTSRTTHMNGHSMSGKGRQENGEEEMDDSLDQIDEGYQGEHGDGDGDVEMS